MILYVAIENTDGIQISDNEFFGMRTATEVKFKVKFNF